MVDHQHPLAQPFSKHFPAARRLLWLLLMQLALVIAPGAEPSSPSGGNTPRQVSSGFSLEFERMRELLRQDKNAQALTEMRTLAQLHPDNSELHTYVAFLTLTDVMENPDPELSELFSLFGVSADLIPDSSFSAPSPLPPSAPTLARVQVYAASRLLPALNSSIASVSQAVALGSAYFRAAASLDAADTGFEVDQADLVLLLGALLATKAMALDILSYDLGIDANELEDLVRASMPPLQTEIALADTPRFGRATPDAQTLRNESLQLWLEASKDFRLAIGLMLRETDDQTDDLFCIDQEAALHTRNFLTMLDRIIEAMIQTSAGDYNADGRVDYEDLLVLRSLWHWQRQ